MSEMNQAVSEILAEKAEELKTAEAFERAGVLAGISHLAPREPRDPGPTVEVCPGVMVSQRLIDEAVRLTPGSDLPSSADAAEAVERKHFVAEKARQELKQDISTSKQIIESMLARMREPLKADEKYVSYDAMPGPLQRVIKAYMDVDAANKELNEAIKALAQTAPPAPAS